MLTELTIQALACHSIRQNLFYTIGTETKRSEFFSLMIGSAFGAREKSVLARSLHCDLTELKLRTGYGITMQAAEKPYVPARVLFSWVFIRFSALLENCRDLLRRVGDRSVPIEI